MSRANVYLTGLMGSGKSTVGPLVATGLGAIFVDLDAAIEEAVGVSIARVFEEDGEAAFRRVEQAALQATTERRGLVVATGGGTLLTDEAYERAARAGTVVYLRVPAAILVRRLAREAAHRPLLHTADGRPLEGEALRSQIEALLEARADAYERADVVVQADDLPPPTLAAWIAAAVRTPTADAGD